MDWSIEKVNQNDKICTLIFWIFLLAKQLWHRAMRRDGILVPASGIFWSQDSSEEIGGSIRCPSLFGVALANERLGVSCLFRSSWLVGVCCPDFCCWPSNWSWSTSWQIWRFWPGLWNIFPAAGNCSELFLWPYIWESRENFWPSDGRFWLKEWTCRISLMWASGTAGPIFGFLKKSLTIWGT